MSTLYIFLSKQYFCKVSRLLKRNKGKLKHEKTKNGFTLVELLLVITILSILAIVSVVGYS